MKTTKKQSRASRSAAPRGSASLTIQHERWAAERWKVMLRVNRMAFAIGAECDTLHDAQQLRTDFKAALCELGVNSFLLPTMTDAKEGG